MAPGTHSDATRGSLSDGDGRAGTDGSTAARLRADVRSPTALRRHGDRFGTSTPKRVAMRRRNDVGSNVSEHTNPPRLKGEMTNVGTRKPSPMGPRIPSASLGSVPIDRYSPGVPGGGTGGATWSKKPPFSSHVRKN